jgi:RNA polymerase sigma-70 factor, ECF subfamily
MNDRQAAPLIAPSRRRTSHPLQQRGARVQLDATTDDALLVAAVAGGNEEALRALYDRYGGLVFTVALRMVGDRDIAQEIVQDVFLRCWERASTFDASRGRAHAWLMAVARNRAIDVLRGAQHQARSRDRELLPGDYSRPSLTHHDHGDSVALHLSVADALGALPEAQRRTLELVLMAGLTQREIAEVMQLPLGTVKTRIRDGLIRLRAQLAGTPPAAAARRTGVADA